MLTISFDGVEPFRGAIVGVAVETITRFILISFAVLVSFPALAMDCRKTLSHIERLICSDPKLQKSDEDMSHAYFKLLRETSDPDFHEALIVSQRRWLKVRSAGPERYGAAADDQTDDAEVLLKLTVARSNFLRNSKAIRKMEQQRAFAKIASGGAFVGFNSSCLIMPPPYGYWNYQCFGTEQQQNNDRVCSITTEIASGHMTDTRKISILKEGKPKIMASCSIGYAETSENCPGSSRDDAHWNIDPEAVAGSPILTARELSKYDPDIEFADNDRWIVDCLSASTYPPPDEGRSGQGKKQ